MQTMDGIVHHRHKYVRRGAEVEFRCADVNDATGVAIVHLMRPHLFNATQLLLIARVVCRSINEDLTTVLNTSVLFGC